MYSDLVFFFQVWKTQFLVEFRHRYFKIGTARHTQEQQEEVSCRDLRALEDAAESGEDKVRLFPKFKK